MKRRCGELNWRRTKCTEGRSDEEAHLGSHVHGPDLIRSLSWSSKQWPERLRRWGVGWRRGRSETGHGCKVDKDRDLSGFGGSRKEGVTDDWEF